MRIIQVGLGMWGWGWLEVLCDADGVEIAGIVDVSAALRERAAETFDLSKAQLFADVREALAGVEADAVLVVTPPATHCEIVTKALEAGLDVLTEKPLAMTMSDAWAMVAASERTGRILMVSQTFRFRGPARTVQALIASGQLGDIISIVITCHKDTRALFKPHDHRYQMRHPVLLDMSVHHFDLVRALTGQDITRVDARSWRAPDSPYEHDPAVAALLTLSGGAPVVYTHDMAARGPETSWNGHWEVLGDKGRLTWARAEHVEDLWDDMFKAQIVLWSNGGPEPVEQVDVSHVDRIGTLEAFRLAIEEGGPMETAASDNVKTLAAVMACIESVDARAPVDVAAVAVRPG